MHRIHPRTAVRAEIDRPACRVECRTHGRGRRWRIQAHRGSREGTGDCYFRRPNLVEGPGHGAVRERLNPVTPGRETRNRQEETRGRERRTERGTDVGPLAAIRRHTQEHGRLVGPRIGVRPYMHRVHPRTAVRAEIDRPACRVECRTHGRGRRWRIQAHRGTRLRVGRLGRKPGADATRQKRHGAADEPSAQPARRTWK